MSTRPTEVELVRCARNVARLQKRQAQLKRELKKIKTDLRLEQKHLRALAARGLREPDVMPSKLTNGATGYKAVRVERVDDVPVTTSELFPDGD